MIISLRDFEKDKADVVYIYGDEDTKRLKRKGLLHDNLIPKDEDEDGSFRFQEENNEDSDEEEKVTKEEPKVKVSNITIQDFGLPPIEDDYDDDIENI